MEIFDDFLRDIGGTEGGAPDECFLEKVWEREECPAFAKRVSDAGSYTIIHDSCEILGDCHFGSLPEEIEITPEIQEEAERLGIVIRRDGCWHIVPWDTVEFF